MNANGDPRVRVTWAAVVFWAAAIVFVAGVFVGASGGVRGSDQYWYLDDTETLLRGDPPYSNALYPRQLIAQGIERSPFMHDILPQRAVIPVARVAGPYWSWIVVNTAAMLVGALFTFLAVRRLGDPLLAAWAGALLLLLPLSVFSASQVLAEAFMVPFLGAAIWLIGRPPSAAKYVLLALVMTLALMSRVTVLPWIALLPFAPLLERTEWRRRIGLSMLTAGLVIGGVLVNKWLFKGIPIEGNALVFGINGRGMSMWLGTEPVVFSFEALRAKLEESVTLLFAGSTAMRVFNATSWLLMIASLVGAIVAWRRGERLTAIAVVAVVGVNVFTLALYQNQIRYAVPSYPVLLVAAAFVVDRFMARTGRGRALLAAASFLLLAPLALVIAFGLRSEGLREAAIVDRTRAAAEKLVGEGDVIYVGGNDQMFAHSMRPRTVLFVRHPESKANWEKILAMPRWRCIACEPQAVAELEKLGVRGTVIVESEHRGVPFVYLELATAPENRDSPLFPLRK